MTQPEIADQSARVAKLEAEIRRLRADLVDLREMLAERENRGRNARYGLEVGELTAEDALNWVLELVAPTPTDEQVLRNLRQPGAFAGPPL